MPAPENTVQSNPEQPQQQPVRELTQTDRINKRLLTALYKSIDEGGEESIAKMMEPENNSPPQREEQEKEWTD